MAQHLKREAFFIALHDQYEGKGFYMSDVVGKLTMASGVPSDAKLLRDSLPGYVAEVLDRGPGALANNTDVRAVALLPVMVDRRLQRPRCARSSQWSERHSVTPPEGVVARGCEELATHASEGNNVVGGADRGPVKLV